jgi:phosphopantothenate-cysteine ligase
MKVMVTAGGTREYIDDVRVVTNISTGALGCKIAEAFLAEGSHVFYVHAKGTPMPKDPEEGPGRLTSEQFVTSDDLYTTMKTYCSGMKMDAVIHSAAVSDFTFRRDVPVKVSSESEEGFIEHLRQTIVRTPKIVKSVKEWCPKCVLVSFKFTVGKTPTELCNIAWRAGRGCQSDFVLANDKQQMSKNKEHVAYLVCTNQEPIVRCGIRRATSWYASGKDSIASAIVSTVNGAIWERNFNMFDLEDASG